MCTLVLYSSKFYTYDLHSSSQDWNQKPSFKHQQKLLNKQHFSNFWQILLFYYYLVNILKVLSLSRKGNRTIIRHNTHSKPCCTLRAGWMKEYKRDILQKSKFYNQMLLLPGKQASEFILYVLTMRWWFHLIYPSRTFLQFQSPGPHLSFYKKKPKICLG